MPRPWEAQTSKKCFGTGITRSLKREKMLPWNRSIEEVEKKRKRFLVEDGEKLI